MVLDVFATLIPSYETVSPPPQPQSQEKQILQEQQQQQHKKKSKNVYGIWCVDLHQLGYGGYRPRLWFRPGDMHYTDRHYDFKRRDSDDPSTGQIYADVGGLVLHHDHNCRPPWREERRKEYQWRLEGLESES